MDHPLARLARQRFETFAAGYLEDPGDTYAYRLKIAHTGRVADFAEEIVREEGLPQDLALAAVIAATLHDVGRFPQYRRYRTFRDAESANHGAYGVSRILRNRMLDGMDRDLRRLVLGAVYLHNKRGLPGTLPEPLSLVSRVVRDADKLDIYELLIRHFTRKDTEHPEISLSCKDEPDKFTPRIIEALLRHEAGDYRDIAYANDFILLVIGWVYDLNFRTSLRILGERRFTERLFALLPPHAPLLSFRGQVEADLARLRQDAYLPGERLKASLAARP